MSEQVEERLEFFETGVATRKNEEVMREAVDEYQSSIQLAVKQQKKKKKKQKKEALEGVEVAEQVEVEVEVEVEDDSTKKENSIAGSPEVTPVSKKKSKKKRKSQIELLTEGIENYKVDSSEKTPKRRKKLRTS